MPETAIHLHFTPLNSHSCKEGTLKAPPPLLNPEPVRRKGSEVCVRRSLPEVLSGEGAPTLPHVGEPLRLWLWGQDHARKGRLLNVHIITSP